MRDIRGLVRTALEPEKIARLVEILDDNHGYRLYQAVSRLKEALSAETEACSASRPATSDRAARCARAEFEGWIAPELEAIDRRRRRGAGRAPG